MVSSAKYPKFDDLCKMFFAKELVFVKGGKFIGSCFGQSIKKCCHQKDIADVCALAPQQQRIVNEIARAQNDKSPASKTFLDQVDTLIEVSGNLINSEICVIRQSDLDSLLVHMKTEAHDRDAVGSVLDYLRTFYNHGESWGCYFKSKCGIASLALDWGYATFADYSVLISKYNNIESQKDFIKPLLSAARAEVLKLSTDTTHIRNKCKAIQLCDDVIYRFLDMAAPMYLIDAVHKEFNHLKIALLKGEVANSLDSDLAAKTDAAVSMFFEGRFCSIDSQHTVVQEQDKSSVLEQAVVVPQESVVEMSGQALSDEISQEIANCEADEAKLVTVHLENNKKNDSDLLKSDENSPSFESGISTCDTDVGELSAEARSDEAQTTKRSVAKSVVKRSKKTTAPDNDVSTIGFYSETKRAGFLHGLLGRRR